MFPNPAVQQQVSALRAEVNRLVDKEQLAAVKADVKAIQDLAMELDSISYASQTAAEMPRRLAEIKRALQNLKEAQDMVTQLRSNA